MLVRFLVSFLLLSWANLLSAQQMSGIFQATDATLEYAEQLSWEDFIVQKNSLNEKGYRLTNVETTGIGNDRRYWGIFTESTLTDTIIKTESWPEFVKAKRAMAASGRLLTNVQAYALGETDAHFIGVWRTDAESTPHKIWKLDGPESLRQKTEDMAKQQYYIQEVEVFLSPSGIATYLAIYHYSPIPVRNYVYLVQDEKTFNTDRNLRQRSKIRLIDFERFSAKEGEYYLGVYQPGNYDYRTIFNLPRGDFNGQWEQLEKDNLQLVSWEVRD